MHSDPKRDAQRTEDAGYNGLPEETPSVVNPSPSMPGISMPNLPTPPQGPMRPPTPSRQDRLDLERSAGEGMTAPPSKP